MKIFVFFLLSQVARAEIAFERIEARSPVLITRAELLGKVNPAACKTLPLLMAQNPEGWAAFDPKAAVAAAWGAESDSDWKGALENCAHFPCAVKLDQEEVEIMASRPKESRTAEWGHLVSERFKKYITSRKRRAYEFPGGIADPWADSDKNPSWAKSSHDQYFATVLSFLGSSYRKVRQLLHRQWKVETAPDGATVAQARARDIYTAHYFDSWGEFYEIRCTAQGEVSLHGEAAIELDQLKATDFLSRLGRSKMRRSVFEQSEKYLGGVLQGWLKLLEISGSSTDPNPNPNTPKGK